MSWMNDGILETKGLIKVSLCLETGSISNLLMHFCFSRVFFPMFPPRADACIAGLHCYRCPAPAVVAAVGEFGVQPDTLPHLLSVPLLPIHHGRRRRRPQHHCARVPGSRTQQLTLHAAWSATLPRHPCPSVTGQPRGEERGQRGHVPDRRGQ